MRIVQIYPEFQITLLENKARQSLHNSKPDKSGNTSHSFWGFHRWESSRYIRNSGLRHWSLHNTKPDKSGKHITQYLGFQIYHFRHRYTLYIDENHPDLSGIPDYITGKQGSPVFAQHQARQVR